MASLIAKNNTESFWEPVFFCCADPLYMLHMIRKNQIGLSIGDAWKDLNQCSLSAHNIVNREWLPLITAPLFCPGYSAVASSLATTLQNFIPNRKLQRTDRQIIKKKNLYVSLMLISYPPKKLSSILKGVCMHVWLGIISSDFFIRMALSPKDWLW